MEKVLTEQALARLTINHCKIAASQLALLATETANPALRDEVQKALQANLDQQHRLWDAAFHAGYLPNTEFGFQSVNKGDKIAPSLADHAKEGR
jgi:spore coat protein CotF